jgi:hypothetical protein
LKDAKAPWWELRRTAYQVIEEQDQLARVRGEPRSIRFDKSPDFAGQMLDQCAYLNTIEVDFLRPGLPRISVTSRYASFGFGNFKKQPIENF